MRSAAALLLWLPVAACHRRQPAELAAACQPATQTELSRSAATTLGGSHDVTFIVSSGPRSGHALTARLDLRDQVDSLRRGPWSPAEQRFVGNLDVSPEDLGAVRMGDPDVGVYVTTSASGVAISARVGTLSNGRGDQPFDAGYFALHVREIEGGVIRGAWASGDGRNEVAAGHFCARRQ